jgi:hypothetical protein
MTWIERFDNNMGIKNLFNKLPLIDDVILKKIILDWEGPSIIFHLDLNDYPENPPRKWKTSNFNTVHLELDVSLEKLVSLTGWNNETRGTFQFLDDNLLLVKGEEFQLECKYSSLCISKISAYMNT